MKKKLKWCSLLILFLLCLIVIPITFSKYTKSFNRSITVNVRKPEYKIKFNANGGTGTMANLDMVYGTAKNLTANTFTRTNANFLGWNTKADGTGTSYSDKQSVKNLSSTDKDTVNLYAKWQLRYTVTFNSNGGSSVPSQNVFDGLTATKPSDPTKPDYIFDGWQLNGADYNFATPVTGNITLTAKWKSTSTLLDGLALSAKIRSLANNGATISDAYKYEDSKTKAIKYATETQYEAMKSSLNDARNLISTPGSPEKTYAWFDSSTGTTYFYSEAGKIYMNPDSQKIFAKMPNLTDISALANFDTSKVTDTNRLFQNSNKLVNLSPIAGWDVSKVTDMRFMFGISSTTDKMALTDKSLESLANWDVSSVLDFNQMFKSCRNITKLDSLARWNVSSAKDFEQMFNYCTGLTDAKAIEGWDVTNVTNFNKMFDHTTNLTANGDNRPIFTSRPGTWDNNGTYKPST